MAETVAQERFFAIVPKSVLYHPDLKASDIRVYAALSEHAGKKRQAWPGVRKIAAEIHCSPDTVRKSVARLEISEAIEIDRSKGESNHYWLPSGGVPKISTVPDEGVPETSTPVYQESAQAVPKIGTELDPITRPIELQPPQPPSEGPPETAAGRAGGSRRSADSPPEAAASRATGPVDPELPAIRWARRWSEIRGVRFTKTVKRNWSAQVQEYLSAGGQPTDQLLEHAHRESIREPKGWAYVESSVAHSERSKELNEWMADR